METISRISNNFINQQEQYSRSNIEERRRRREEQLFPHVSTETGDDNYNHISQFFPQQVGHINKGHSSSEHQSNFNDYLITDTFEQGVNRSQTPKENKDKSKNSQNCCVLLLDFILAMFKYYVFVNCI